MSFDCSDLKITVMRNEVIGLREMSYDIAGNYLLRLHSDHMCIPRLDRKHKVFSTDLADIHRMFQMRRALFDLHRSIPVDAFALEINIKNIEVLHVVKYDEVSLIARSDSSHVLKAIALCGVDGGHLDSLERVETQLNGSSYVIYDMAFPEDVLNMLIVSAEAEMFSVYACPHDAFDDVVHIVSCRAFADMNVYASSGFLKRILER